MDDVKIAISEFSKLLTKNGVYAMPQKYPSWESVISLASTHLVRLNVSTDLDDLQELEHSQAICFWTKFIDKEVPVYCITEELLEMFSMTDVSNIYTLIPDDWEPPLSDALFVYPNRFIHAEKTMVFSACSFARIKEFDRKQENDPTIARVLAVTSYASDNDTYKEMLNVRESARNSVDCLLNFDESNSFLFPIIIQCFLAMSYCPELFDSFDGETKTLGFGKKDLSGKLNSRNLRPRWLGKNIQKERISRSKVAHSTHSAPEKHWRRGHWRNQPCGKKGEDRKIVWIRPVLVGC